MLASADSKTLLDNRHPMQCTIIMENIHFATEYSSTQCDKEIPVRHWTKSKKELHTGSCLKCPLPMHGHSLMPLTTLHSCLVSGGGKNANSQMSASTCGTNQPGDMGSNFVMTTFMLQPSTDSVGHYHWVWKTWTQHSSKVRESLSWTYSW